MSRPQYWWSDNDNEEEGKGAASINQSDQANTPHVVTHTNTAPATRDHTQPSQHDTLSFWRSLKEELSPTTKNQ